MTTTLLDAALQLAAKAHAGQRRKYTNHPYLTHCLEVVNILIDHGVEDEVMLAAAALHDVIEDCKGWDAEKLRWQLWDKSCHKDNPTVVALVKQLTEPQHEGNRATRKAAECLRLSQICADAQTIKCADLVSNTGSIAQFDPGFAKVYLQEKWNILKVMRNGDEGLLDYALIVCSQAADEIGLELT